MSSHGPANPAPVRRGAAGSRPAPVCRAAAAARPAPPRRFLGNLLWRQTLGMMA